jgi:transposase
VPAAGTNRRISVFGALEYATGTVVSMVADQADGPHFIAFLEQVRDRYRGRPLILVMDNAGYHKSRLVKAWFARHVDRILVLTLPPYSPDLNLIERVWRLLKHQLACHRFWNDIESLRERVRFLLDHVVAHFHQPTRGGLRLCHYFHLST